jgi:hypothetical protein
MSNSGAYRLSKQNTYCRRYLPLKILPNERYSVEISKVVHGPVVHELHSGGPQNNWDYKKILERNLININK